MNINEALNYIQVNLVATKDLNNSFGKYKYRSAESILEALKPLLAHTKATLVMNDDIIMVGNRIYVKATATLTDFDGKSINANAFAREDESKKGMDASQLTGATSSYARKYALSALFCIDDNKDADATNTHDKEPAVQLPVDVSNYIASLSMIESVEMLQNAWGNISPKYKGNDFVSKQINKATNIRKEEITQEH